MSDTPNTDELDVGAQIIKAFQSGHEAKAIIEALANDGRPKDVIGWRSELVGVSINPNDKLLVLEFRGYDGNAATCTISPVTLIKLIAELSALGVEHKLLADFNILKGVKTLDLEQYGGELICTVLCYTNDHCTPVAMTPHDCSKLIEALETASETAQKRRAYGPIEGETVH